MSQDKTKALAESPKKNGDILEESACYVLITCGQPTKDGKMQVELTYEGDPALAAYLVESAQGFFDEECSAL